MRPETKQHTSVMNYQRSGCLNCKKRKVKCDRRPPGCIRCTRAGLTCHGYPTLKFVDEKPRLERSMSIARIQQEEYVKTRHQIVHSGRIPRISPVMPVTGFEETIFISFLIGKVFKSRPHYECGVTSMAVPWIEEMAKSRHKALDALATMFFGRAKGLQDVITKAVKLYGEAVLDMQADLSKSNAESFQTLASVTALCMYELVGFRSNLGWTLHAAALGRLMEIRGPERYKTFPEKTLFLEHRAIVVSNAILFRRGIFLDASTWKTIPWEDDPDSKQPADYIMDYLCEIAGILEAIDQHSSSRLKLASRIAHVFDGLNRWWCKWRTHYPFACREAFPDLKSTIIRDEEGLIFPSLFQFDSLWSAYAICLYNTARILLLQLWQKVVMSDSLTDILMDSRNPTPLLGISSDMQGLAHEIIRAMEYCQAESRRFLGFFCVVFPFDVAYGCLDKNSREARFLAAKMKGNSFFLDVIESPVGSKYPRVVLFENAVPRPWTEASSACIH